MNDESKKSIEDRILDEIRTTGYPLELDVADWLISNGWHIFPNYLYEDVETQKLRTVDIAANYPLARASKLAHLVLECKTSSKGKPWIFLLTHSIVEEQLSLRDKKGSFLVPSIVSIGGILVSLFQSYVDFEGGVGKSMESESLLQNLLEKANRTHFFDNDLPRAHSCYVAFRKGRDKEDVPDDFVKAVHQINGACAELIEMPFRSPVLATIVFRGDMFGLRKSGNEMKLFPINHALYLNQYFLKVDASQLPKHSIPPPIIDVVKDTYFEEYLGLLRCDLEILEEAYILLEKEGVKP
jgi:hypothetical protein